MEGVSGSAAAYLAMLQQKYLLVKLLSLAFYFSLPLSFFLENKEKEAVKSGWVLTPGILRQEAAAAAVAHICTDTSRDTGHTHSVTCPSVSGCVASSRILVTCLLRAQ